MGGFFGNWHLGVHLFDQLFEGDWLLYGEFGEHLAIELHALRFLCRDESAVGESEEAERIPEADDPEATERSLFVVSIPTGIFPRLDEGFLCGDEVRLPPPAETDGLREYILSSLVGGDASFHSGHIEFN